MSEYPHLSHALALRTDPDDHLALWVGAQVAVQKLKHAQDQVFKAFGISAAQYNVLRILDGAGAQGLPCSAIAQRVIDKDPDMTRMLDRLERLELVTRWRDSVDRRSVRAALSEHGKQRLQALREPIATLQQQRLSTLSRKDIRSLAKGLDQLIGALDDRTHTDP
ncbi:MAG: MarR family transcriptional regulator [Planctomycetota bacterium]|nr:MAG: MarR family transcriptional regulator [Planctomycetota bacterium]